MVSRVGMLALLVLVLARVHAAVGAHADFEQPSAGAVPIVRPLPRHAPSHGASGGNFRKLPAAGRMAVWCAENVIGRFCLGPACRRARKSCARIGGNR
jgi:hypothetical protein